MKDITKIKKTILALNEKNKPYIYKVEGNKIIGTWGFVDANFVGISGLSQDKRKYIVTFILNTDKGTYDFTENKKEIRSSIGINGLVLNRDWQKGKMIERRWVWIPGFGIKNKNEERKIIGKVSYKFNTYDIKAPIINILNENGFKPKNWFTKFFSK